MQVHAGGERLLRCEDPGVQLWYAKGNKLWMACPAEHWRGYVGGLQGWGTNFQAPDRGMLVALP